MTLAAAAAQVRLIVGCKDAAIRSSPIPPGWLLAAAPRPPFSIGASGSSAPAAAAGRSIWWWAGRGSAL